MKTLLLLAAGFALITFTALGQSAPAPASDDPMAGLNLSDKPKSADDSAPSRFIQQFKGHLIILDHDTPTDYDVANLAGVKYWAFLYSASWCGPCREFSPKLVDFYSYFKKSHPNFEVILVGNDGKQDDMVKYMQEDRMPWPAMKYPDLDDPRVSVKKYFGSGIPDLVLVDSNGKVLSDTFSGKDYVGPSHVLEDIKKMVPRPDDGDGN